MGGLKPDPSGKEDPKPWPGTAGPLPRATGNLLMDFPQIQVLGLILSCRAQLGSSPGPAHPQQPNPANPSTQDCLGTKDNENLRSLLEMCLAAGLPHRAGGTDFMVLAHRRWIYPGFPWQEGRRDAPVGCARREQAGKITLWHC